MTQQTNRPISPGAEAWLIRPPTKVLDRGWVKVVDYMGNDDSIDRAARQSYGDKARSVRDSAHLIDYLMGHQHSSPFEACELTVQIHAPIFVARQWFRHRTASPNEQSARYSTLESDFYLPGLDTMRAQSRANHQGRGGSSVRPPRRMVRRPDLRTESSGGRIDRQVGGIHGGPAALYLPNDSV